MTTTDTHPLIVAAAGGQLPEWAQVTPDRRRHLESVADLLKGWAAGLGLDRLDQVRWAAAGWLHDALRDADPAELAVDAGEYPASLRHGPATAARLDHAGIGDPELVEAVCYHSVGWRGFQRLGRFLYLADYLEPLRSFNAEWRAALRARLPQEGDDVLQAVCAERIARLVERRSPLRTETAEFWNELVGAR